MRETQALVGPETIDLDGVSVFVTGATGFIGSHLVRRLYALGAKLSVLMRPGADISKLGNLCHEIGTYESDLTDGPTLRTALLAARPRHVFHLAAYTQVERDCVHADVAMRINLTGTMRLTEALYGLDVTSVVNSGTCEEYGDSEPPMSEHTLLRPVSPYSVSKAAATLWCQMVHQTTGTPIVTVRPFLCYGPAQQAIRLIPQAILAALTGREFRMTGGEQTREFTHVTDIVEGYIHAALTPAAIGQVINLGSGEEHRIRDVVKRIFAIAEADTSPLIGAVPYRSAELWRCVSNCDKAKRMLGWTPCVRLEDGLRDTIAWYRQHMSTQADEVCA